VVIIHTVFCDCTLLHNMPTCVQSHQRTLARTERCDQRKRDVTRRTRVSLLQVRISRFSLNAKLTLCFLQHSSPGDGLIKNEHSSTLRITSADIRLTRLNYSPVTYRKRVGYGTCSACLFVFRVFVCVLCLCFCDNV